MTQSEVVLTLLQLFGFKAEHVRLFRELSNPCACNGDLCSRCRYLADVPSMHFSLLEQHQLVLPNRTGLTESGHVIRDLLRGETYEARRV